MALDIVHGEARNRQAGLQLAEAVGPLVDDGTIYLGYPVLSTADGRVHVDALLVSRDHGLVAFVFATEDPQDLASWARLITEQDRLYGVLDSRLGRHDELRRGRDLAIEIATVTVFPSTVQPPDSIEDGSYVALSEVADLVESLPPLEESLYRALQASLQRVTTIRPAKRRTGVNQANSKGAALKEIEREMANLDQWQKQAAIETPAGPQMIRGLAGSGKTVVLALKAAYLHAQHPEWQIAVVFHTRALYQQFEDLITRFSFAHSDDRPDFDHLQIVHAWGASNRNGVYKSISRHMNTTFRDFRYAMDKYGRNEAFAGVCRELLEVASQSRDEPIFDAVLIDEAQDLPREFFQLVYRFTSEPKRIIWAYDELQNLSESEMPATEELFGSEQNGTVLRLENIEGEARQDIVLPVCYRNPPWALATAHALGFGIYRDEGLVQHFDDVDLWSKIGYRVASGRLRSGKKVELERSPSSYPDYFTRLIDPDDAVVLQTFKSEIEHDSWVADQIQRNLEEDELEHEDILVVLPSPITAKRRASKFGRVLDRLGIDSHLAGVASSVDEVFMPNSVAIAHIHRAKGNEAPMVYVLDSQFAARPFNVVSRRNALFTAVTRSRAWVRICGWGDGMEKIAEEIQKVREASFRLKFKIPTADDLTTMRRIHRERSEAELETIERTTQTLREALISLESGNIDLSDFPADVRTRLADLLRRKSTDGDT